MMERAAHLMTAGKQKGEWVRNKVYPLEVF